MLMVVMGRAVRSLLVRFCDVRRVIMMMTMPTCHGLPCRQAEVIRSARHGCAHRAPHGEQHGKQQQKPDAQDLHDLQSSTGFRQSV